MNISAFKSNKRPTRQAAPPMPVVVRASVWAPRPVHPTLWLVCRYLRRVASRWPLSSFKSSLNNNNKYNLSHHHSKCHRPSSCMSNRDRSCNRLKVKYSTFVWDSSLWTRSKVGANLRPLSIINLIISLLIPTCFSLLFQRSDFRCRQLPSRMSCWDRLRERCNLSSCSFTHLTWKTLLFSFISIDLSKSNRLFTWNKWFCSALLCSVPVLCQTGTFCCFVN